MANLKYISELPVLEQTTEQTYLLVEQDGVANRIPASAVGTNDNMPFKKIVGTNENPVVLRNLTENGTYYLSGKFKHHETDKVSSLVEGFYIVKWTKDASYIVRHSASDTSVRYYTIQDDSYTAKQFNHADITTAIERISALEERVTALEGSQDALITFTISGETRQAEEGMTWAEWCNSEYGYYDVDVYGNYTHDSSGVSWEGQYYIIDQDDNFVKSEQLIIAGYEYRTKDVFEEDE